MVNDELITEFKTKANIFSHLSTSNSLQSTMLKASFYFARHEIIWLFSFSITSKVIFLMIKSFDLRTLKRIPSVWKKIIDQCLYCQFAENY